MDSEIVNTNEWAHMLGAVIVICSKNIFVTVRIFYFPENAPDTVHLSIKLKFKAR